ncbi:uncharacterized protein EDB93DRAFT_1108241 [Suillus bovinus]|uniref:uncharacterized protein n=1 Tax=Suillus bovinus TaxID=48563 RepID=UPI001B87DB83|nr:uncharacterized protein EDB93DRAFT_1108241 [Suillus bovinus]KAG2130941.1 hypothetical protein EDB93DRAFT_1108241 [Suillus bovinus]
MHVGYSYIPPSHVNRQPIILDWFADEVISLLQHVGFAAIKDTHIKIAYVQEGSNMGYLHHSIYLNTHVYPGISVRFSGLVGVYQDSPCTLQSNQFIVPNGWRAKVVDPIANLVHDFFHNPEPSHRNIFLDLVVCPAPVLPVAGYTALSPVGMLFTPDSVSLYSNSDIFAMSESDWMDPTPILPAACSIPLTLPPYDLSAIYVNTLLLPHGSVIGIQRPSVFIGCNLNVFIEGITYMPTYLKSHFPAAWTIISDARLMARNYLTINQGGEAAFRSYCVQAITEMQTVGSASPQPAESGLQCRETSKTKLLKLMHPDVIELLYSERSAFMRSVRTCMQSFIEELKKAGLAGFSLKTKTPAEVKALIQHLTNMTGWESDVTSIAFTFDNNNNPYRNKALLVNLAHWIMRPINGRPESLLTLFPKSYMSLPKHLIDRICSLTIAFFRTYLSDNNLSFTHALDEEHCCQLHFLTMARSGTDDQSMALEHWLTTCSGPDGWETTLRLLEEFASISNNLITLHDDRLRSQTTAISAEENFTVYFCHSTTIFNFYIATLWLAFIAPVVHFLSALTNTFSAVVMVSLIIS